MPFMSVPVGMVQRTAGQVSVFLPFSITMSSPCALVTLHHFAGNLMLTSLSYFSWSMAVPFFLPVAR